MSIKPWVFLRLAGVLGTWVVYVVFGGDFSPASGPLILLAEIELRSSDVPITPFRVRLSDLSSN